MTPSPGTRPPKQALLVYTAATAQDVGRGARTGSQAGEAVVPLDVGGGRENYGKQRPWAP